MRFKIKDLLIKIMPEANTCKPWEQTCCVTICTVTADICLVSNEMAGTQMIADPQEHLASLKQQLRRAIENVEAEEKQLEERMRPRTLEEIELLEQKLLEALEELRAQKDELKKKQ